MFTGVNYWPRQQYVDIWRQFNLSEIKEDFVLLKRFNMEVVRFFLLWEDFQPMPEVIDPQKLRYLDQVLSALDRLEMKAIVTVFNGLMGFGRYLPHWAMSPALQKTQDVHKRFYSVGGQVSHHIPYNFYTDLMSAQQLLLTAVGQVTKEHSSVWMLDLANEPNFVQEPTIEEASTWIKAMSSSFKSVDPYHPVTLGGPFAEEGGWPFETLTGLDILSIHKSYDFDEDGRLIQDNTWMEVEMCRSTNKPFLIEEWGMPTRGQKTRSIQTPVGKVWIADEDLQARMLKDVLTKAEQKDALALLVWDAFDFDPTFTMNPSFDIAPYEAWFGLFRTDRSPKPAALVMQEYRQSRSQGLERLRN